MGKPSKRTSTDDGKVPSKRQKQLIVPPACEDDMSENITSSDQESPDGDASIIDQSDITRFADSVTAGNLKLVDSKKQADDFERRVKIRQADTLTSIARCRQKLKDDKKAYNNGLLSFISALSNPLMTEDKEVETQKDEILQLQMSLILTQDEKVSEISKQLLADTNMITAMNLDFVNRQIKERRIAKLQNDMRDDKQLTIDLLAAGRKKCQAQIQEKLGTGIQRIFEKMTLTEEEEKHAAVLASLHPASQEDEELDNGAGAGWNKYVRTLIRVVQKTEEITDLV